MKPITAFELAKLIGKIPTDVLPRRERAVLRAMADRYPNIWPSAVTLGKEAGYSPGEVSKAWTSLLKGKLIYVHAESHRKGGKSTTTRYIIDVEAVAALVPNPVNLNRNPVNLKPNPVKFTGLSVDTLSKSQTNKQVRTNKQENKEENKRVSQTQPSPRVKATMRTLFSFFADEEGKPLKATREQRQNLAEDIVAYGPFVVPAWKEYLKLRSSDHPWPVYDFIGNVETYIKLAEKEQGELAQEIWKLRRLIFCMTLSASYYDFEEALTPEDLAAIESHNAWMRKHKEDDPSKACATMPLDNAGRLFELQERRHAWYELNRERLDREQNEYYEQHKDDEIPVPSNQE